MKSPTQHIRNSFVFYRSFFETISDLSDADQLEIYRAIAEFSLNEKTINLVGLPKTIFRLIEPQLQANKRKFENGLKGAAHGIKGGRPKDKKTPKKPQANPKLTPNVNDNVNDNDNDNVNEESKFESFWNLYGKKLSRPEAQKKFKAALKKDTFENIIAGVEKYIKARGPDSQYWKHPSTWLYQECWKDEYSTTTNKLPSKHNNFEQQDYYSDTKGFLINDEDL